jgi:hypothetical protein
VRQVVATRQAGDWYTLSNQTPRPAAVASEMGQNRTGAPQHVGAEDVTSHKHLHVSAVQNSRILLGRVFERSSTEPRRPPESGENTSQNSFLICCLSKVHDTGEL